MKLNLDIRHLIVDAAGPVDPAVLREQIRADLTRRFAAGGLPGNGAALDRLIVPLPPGDTIGAQLGAALHGIVPGSTPARPVHDRLPESTPSARPQGRLP